MQLYFKLVMGVIKHEVTLFEINWFILIFILNSLRVSLYKLS